MPESFTEIVHLRDDLLRKIEQTKGKKEEIVRRLKETFNIDSIEKAEVFLKDLKEELTDLQEEYDDLLLKFKEKWDNVL